MKKHHFDIILPYQITIKGAFKKTTTIIFCDYTREVIIEQFGNEYPAKLGYCGKDKKTTRPRYLFIDNKVYHLDDTCLDIINDIDNKFVEWLFF